MIKDEKPEIVKKNSKSASHQTSHIAIAHQGPLPMASEFAAYERVLPGSADRILGMAEKSLNVEAQDMESRRRMEVFALVSGRLFLYALLAVAVFLVIIDRPIAALLAGLAPIVSVVYGTFTSGSKKKG